MSGETSARDGMVGVPVLPSTIDGKHTAAYSILTRDVDADLNPDLHLPKSMTDRKAPSHSSLGELVRDVGSLPADTVVSVDNKDQGNDQDSDQKRRVFDVAEVREGLEKKAKETLSQVEKELVAPYTQWYNTKDETAPLSPEARQARADLLKNMEGWLQKLGTCTEAVKKGQSFKDTIARLSAAIDYAISDSSPKKKALQELILKVSSIS